MANACARIISAVTIQQSQKAKYDYMANQKMGIYLCKQFLSHPGADGAQLMRDIAQYTEPVRPGQRDQRNLKIKSFPGFVYQVAA